MDYIITKLDGSEALYHHGIKGQKWGVRKYQNPDGSLTEAGKRRYEKIDYKINKYNIQKRFYNDTVNTANKSLRSDYENRVARIKSKGYNVKKENKKIQNARDTLILKRLHNENYRKKMGEINQRSINKLIAKKDPSFKKDAAYIKNKKEVGKRYFEENMYGLLGTDKIRTMEALGYKMNTAKKIGASYNPIVSKNQLRKSKNYDQLVKKYG